MGASGSLLLGAGSRTASISALDGSGGVFVTAAGREASKAFSFTSLGRSALPSVGELASLARVNSPPSASLSRCRKRFACFAPCYADQARWDARARTSVVHGPLASVTATACERAQCFQKRESEAERAELTDGGAATGRQLRGERAARSARAKCMKTLGALTRCGRPKPKISRTHLIHCFSSVFPPTGCYAALTIALDYRELSTG
jgi:hypothetical protein